MIRSMTGFGAAQAGGVRVELSGVNGRGLAVKMRLGEAFPGEKAEARLRGRIHRGTLTVSAARASGDRARLNLKALEGYLKEFEAARRRLPSLPPPDWRTLTSLPGVLEGASADEADLLKALDAAISAFLKDREREGKSLAKILSRLLDEAGDALARAEALRGPAVEAARKRLGDRLSSALGLAAPDEALRRELVLQAERSDFSEEADRLKVHLSEALSCLKAREPIGRRLDFLAQEMMREANTLGAKAADAALAHAAVDLKTALDRFKEQVQNVE